MIVRFTESKMSVAISNSDEGLETSALTGASLLLHGHDLEDLVLEGTGHQEKKNKIELTPSGRSQQSQTP